MRYAGHTSDRKNEIHSQPLALFAFGVVSFELKGK